MLFRFNTTHKQIHVEMYNWLLRHPHRRSINISFPRKTIYRSQGWRKTHENCNERGSWRTYRATPTRRPLRACLRYYCRRKNNVYKCKLCITIRDQIKASKKSYIIQGLYSVEIILYWISLFILSFIRSKLKAHHAVLSLSLTEFGLCFIHFLSAYIIIKWCPS